VRVELATSRSPVRRSNQLTVDPSWCVQSFVVAVFQIDAGALTVEWLKSSQTPPEADKLSRRQVMHGDRVTVGTGFAVFVVHRPTSTRDATSSSAHAHRRPEVKSRVVNEPNVGKTGSQHAGDEDIFQPERSSGTRPSVKQRSVIN